MARKEYEGIEEIIEIFTFDDTDTIKLPKAVREVAFSLAVDIEIVSVKQETYKNFKSSPANSFYGYATLTQRDYNDIIIPLEQPRQRIYYHKNEMAHTSWHNLYLFLLEIEDKRYLYDDRLTLIDNELGIDSSPVNIICPVKPIWEETTLREIYIKCEKGTRFKIELSYWQAKPMEVGGCVYDGKSGIIDGDKDNGLPATGSQPQVAPNPNNPFGGLPPKSSPSELGQFLNLKLPFNDDSNTANEIDDIPATTTTEGYFAELAFLAYGSDSGKPFAVFERIPCSRNSQLLVGQPSAIQTQFGTECNGNFRFKTFLVGITATSYSLPFNIPVGSETFGFNVKFGLLSPNGTINTGVCLVNN